MLSICRNISRQRLRGAGLDGERTGMSATASMGRDVMSVKGAGRGLTRMAGAGYLLVQGRRAPGHASVGSNAFYQVGRKVGSAIQSRRNGR